MIGLNRRLIRIVIYGTSFLIFAVVLLVFANQQKVIDIDQYLPEYLTPSFFQPESNLYIIDISINHCLKLNGNNPTCGIPNDNEGLNGKINDFVGWIKINKDLKLGNSFLYKQFFNYKIIKTEAFKHELLKNSLDKRVITDIAVATPEDSLIKNNVLKIPSKILKEFHSKATFDGEHLIFYSDNSIEGELYKEDSHEHKASDANREYEKQANEKLEDKSLEQEKLNVLKEEEEKIKQLTEEEEKIKQLKEEDETKAKQQKEESEQNDQIESDKSKRTVETNNKNLRIEYRIPTKEQVLEHGWEYRGHGIWVKYEPYTTKKGLTGMDILFGDDAVDPRPNWTLNENALRGIDGKESVRLSVRTGAKKQEFKNNLKVNKDGKLKILQVADLHFSTGYGKCRDPSPESTKKDCLADPRTLKFVEKVLDLEKPDLVVLTGDQIFGDSAPDSATALFKALNPFIARKIPFALTLGNHDDEGSLKRKEIMDIVSNLPFSLAVSGPTDVAGVGNYIVNIQGYDEKNSAILLYLLDTHKYSPNPKVNPGYDWIKESQLKFIEQQYSEQKSSIEKYSKIHLDMAFFHIPIPEYKNLNQPFIGENKEGVTAPRYNTGTRTVLNQLGVKVVSVGHDHCNDYCLQDVQHKDDKMNENKMWLCYGGGSGEGGYGGYGGFIRRLRIYDLDTVKGEIKTWKRLESDPDKPFDEQILVTNGEVVNF